MSEDKISPIILEPSAENTPMHPEDFTALLAWVRAKEGERNPQGFLD